MLILESHAWLVYADASRSAVYNGLEPQCWVLLSLLLHSTGVFVVGRRVQPGLVAKDIRRCLVQHIRGASQSGHIDIGTTKEDSNQDKKVWKRAHST